MLSSAVSHVTVCRGDDDELISLSDDCTTMRPQYRMAYHLSPMTNDHHCDDSDDQPLIPDISCDRDARRSTELGDGEPPSQLDLRSSLVAGKREHDSSDLWSRRQRWIWMFALFAAGAVAFSVRSAMPVAAKFIEIENNWTKTDTGLVLSSFFVGHMLTQVLGGYVSDRFGSERTMTVSMVVWASLTGVTPLLVSGPWSSSGRKYAFAVSRFVTGCAQGFHFPALNSMLARRISSQQRAFSYGFIMSGTYFGSLLTGLIGSVMLQHLGWSFIFYSIGFSGLAWPIFAVVYSLCTRPITSCVVKSTANTVADTSHADDDDAIGGLVRSKNTDFSVPWLTLLGRLPFWALIVAHFCGRWTFFILFSWLPIYFQEVFPTQQAWVYNTVPWIVSIPCQWFAGWLGDTLLRRELMELCDWLGGASYVGLCTTISFGGSGLFVLVMPFVYDNYVATLVCSSMAITFCSFHRSGVVVNVQDIAPKYAGSVFGLMNTAGSLPGFVGVYAAGFLHQTFGNWSAVFISTAINCVVGGVFFLAFASGTAIV